MTVSRRRKQYDPLPDLDISVVLHELGAEHVPTGFGWVPMHCYAHGDRNASASVNHDKNAYRCHSCGRKGDSLKLLQTERSLSFVEVLDLANRLMGVDTSPQPFVRKRRASDLLKGTGT